jgi:hypothetical protein
MATDITGMTGAVTLPGTPTLGIEVIAWSARLEEDLIVIPPAFAHKMKAHALGAGRMSGSLTGRLTSGGTNSAPFIVGAADNATWDGQFSGALTLTADSTATACTYSGNASFFKFAISRPHGGVATVTCDFKFDGAVAVAWDVA